MNDREGRVAFVGGCFRLYCRTADLNVSMASRAVPPKAWILVSQAAATKPPPHGTPQNFGAPATPSSRWR